MRLLLVILAAGLVVSGAILLMSAPPDSIRRLDGSRISFAEAKAFAQQTFDANHVTGAQILITERGKVVWSEAFGLRRKTPELPMTAETTTWAGSITKSVFAVYAMQMVERGELSLDIPVVKQLDKPLNTYEPFRETATELVADPRWPTVTPRMMLSHTSGLGNLVMFEPRNKLQLHHDPGTKYSYSGDGLNIVQFILEQKKGRPLDQLMQDAIFAPLGMKHTGLIYRPEFAENVADRFGAEGQFLAQTRRFPARAAGSMTISSQDLAKFTFALFDGKLLKPASMKAMFSPAISIRTKHQFPLPGDEGIGEDAARVGLAYGLGWGLLTKTPYGKAFFKEGHGDGAQNYMICFERRQSCMIILTNSDNGEKAYRALHAKIFGNTVSPWEWEGY